MEILFEDKSIIVCIKPSGVLSQADIKGSDNMITLLEEYTGGRIYPLHRLDREVGGVMVYAKTKSAAAMLSLEIAEHNFKKEYIALVHGTPELQNGIFEDLLFKDSRKNKSFVVKRERKGVKKASLEYEVLNEKEGLSVVQILLHTGRTHQIRVQFASRRMPLAGDRKYGAKDEFSNMGLWSYRIGFTHPETKQTMVFSKEPQNFIREYM